LGFLLSKLLDQESGICSATASSSWGGWKGELTANPAVPAIFEGAFEHGGVVIRVDVLHRRRDGRWRLIEVKSTADLKDHHLDDVSIQARVVSGWGVDLASVCLAHVNRSYVFQGGTIDARRFFRIRNLINAYFLDFRSLRGVCLRSNQSSQSSGRANLIAPRSSQRLLSSGAVTVSS
jgi:hypothetical protein